MLMRSIIDEGSPAAAGLPSSTTALARSLSAAQQAVTCRPIPTQAIHAGGAAAAALAVQINEESTKARGRNDRRGRAA
jgi:hypothetical protein